jgi:hypothetical protein
VDREGLVLQEVIDLKSGELLPLSEGFAVVHLDLAIKDLLEEIVIRKLVLFEMWYDGALVIEHLSFLYQFLELVRILHPNWCICQDRILDDDRLRFHFALFHFLYFRFVLDECAQFLRL